MFKYLVILFVLVPALELYTLIQVGEKIGVANTILLILLTGITGAQLARTQGASVLMKLQTELAEGREPTKLILDGVLIFVGGLLLLTPGFFTDALGISFLFPPTRKVFSVLLKNWAKKAMVSGNFVVFSGGGFPGQNRPPTPGSQNETGRRTVVDVESERLDDN